MTACYVSGKLFYLLCFYKACKAKPKTNNRSPHLAPIAHYCEANLTIPFFLYTQTLLNLQLTNYGEQHCPPCWLACPPSAWLVSFLWGFLPLPFKAFPSVVTLSQKKQCTQTEM